MSEIVSTQKSGDNTVHVSIYRESLLPQAGAIPSDQLDDKLTLNSSISDIDKESSLPMGSESEFEKLQKETTEKQRKFIRYPESLPKEDELNILNATSELEVIETQGNHDRILTSSIEVSNCIDGKNYLVAIVDIQVDISPLLLHSVGDSIKSRVKCFNDDLKFSPGYYSSHCNINKPAITFTVKKYSAFLERATLKSSDPIPIPIKSRPRDTHNNIPSTRSILSTSSHVLRRYQEKDANASHSVIVPEKLLGEEGGEDYTQYTNNSKKRSFKFLASGSARKKSKPNKSDN